MKAKLILFIVLFGCDVVWAQAKASAVVPITKEPSHHLVLENEYVRVFKVEVAPHSETLYHQHDVDYVFVTLGDSDVESVRVGEQPVRLQLKDGETRFTKGGFAHKAVNLSDKPFVNVTVELKTADTSKGETECFMCGQSQRYTGSSAQLLVDNGKVRVMRLSHLTGFSMGLMGLPHVLRSQGVLVVANFYGIIADTGPASQKAVGCPCPHKNVKPGDVFWIDEDDRFRFESVRAQRGEVERSSTELITIESYVPPKAN
jgi:quercetin dioxygenase-like cupin family protein